jgi:hypothetical protein
MEHFMLIRMLTTHPPGSSGLFTTGSFVIFGTVRIDIAGSAHLQDMT